MFYAVCVCMCARSLVCLCGCYTYVLCLGDYSNMSCWGGHGTTLGNKFSPSTMWVPGTKLFIRLGVNHL